MLCSIISLHFFNVSAAIADTAENVRKLTAPAKKPALLLPNETAKLSFDFGEFKASVTASGEMRVKGWVSHSRVRCADYAVGLRFGQGERACTNVKWLTDPIYLSFKRHCNSAKLEHDGFETDPAIKADFSKITCAQRLLRCSGVCN